MNIYHQVRSFRKAAQISGISKSTICRWWNSLHCLRKRQRLQRKKKDKKTQIQESWRIYKRLVFKWFIEILYITRNERKTCLSTESLKNEKVNDIERHHLLRCYNDSCISRWWNRNVVGSFNILDRAFKSFLLTKPEGPDPKGSST
jgi:hypothetical protein